MNNDRLIGIIIGGMIPVIFGVLFFLLSFLAPRIELKYWKNWKGQRDEKSFLALGVFGISFGTLNLVVSFFNISLYLYWIIPLILFLLIILIIIARRTKIALLSNNNKTGIIAIYFFLAIAILLLLKLPWRLYESGIEWYIPGPLASISHLIVLLAYIAGICLAIAFMLKIVSREIIGFVKKKKDEH